MNKQEAAQFLDVSVRALERYTADNRIAARYEKGKTRSVLVYDESELERFKAELESATHRPAIQKSAPGRAGADWTVEANSPNIANPASGLASFGDVAPGAVPGALADGAMVPAFMSLLQAVADVAPALEKLTAQNEKRGETPVEAKLLLTLDEAHSLTGLSRATLKSAIDGGQLKARIVGRAWRIKRRDLDSFIEDF